MDKVKLPALSTEFSSANLGDPRRTKRLMAVVDAAAAAPGQSLPDRAGSDAQLEATYRFLGNESVTPEDVAEAHFEGTARRAEQEGVVLVPHDTTGFTFGGEEVREGLGRGDSNKQGFLAHMSFCVSLSGEPLGLAAMFAWKREFDEVKGRPSRSTAQYEPDRESLRWLDAVDAVEERLHGRASVIHVQDREGDIYEQLASLIEDDRRFVIRLSHDRRLTADQRAKASENDKLYHRLETAPIFLEREVFLSRRRASPMKRSERVFPSRDARTITLAIRAQRLEIFIGNGSIAHLPPSLTLNFVEAREVSPPEGCDPIIWRLTTSEPIDTPEQVAAVVDMYRQRWLIEEFFKAIKTGCDYEALQLESAQGLLVSLVIDCAVAWRLLRLRWLDRCHPDAPAEGLLNPDQLAVLTAVSAQRSRPLPKNPTVRNVLWAIAGLGGHIKNNGAPGWLVLRRGFDALLHYELGWCAANAARDAIND